MIKATQKSIADSVTPVDDTYVLATEETLKEMVKSFREFLKKDRNLPQKGSRAYPVFQINAVQYVTNIIELTTALIEQGVIESDPYGFLTANVTTFQFANKIINTDLIPLANETITKKHAQNIAKQEAQGEEVSVEEKELNPAQVATIASEPTEDPHSHVVEILTTTKKRWYFDKINFTLSFKKKDGTIKVIKLAKKGSWRATVITMFVKVISWIKKKYTAVKDRCIGIKQTLQFKMLMIKYNRKAKQAEKEAKQKAIDSNVDKAISDLPTNVI